MAQQSDLSNLKGRYNDAILVIEVQSARDQTAVLSIYTNELQTLRTKAQTAGDLEALRTILEEVSRSQTQQSIPTNPPSLPDLKILVARCQKSSQQTTLRRAEQIVAFGARYDKALDALQRRLTQAGQLDDAIAVQAERKALLDTEPLVSAKTVMEASPPPKAVPTVPAPAETTISYAEATRLTSQRKPMDEQQWNALPGKEYTVAGDPRNECNTGIVIERNEQYVVIPCPTDRWNTSPGRWKDADFRGHLDVGDRASNGMPYMQLCYSLDGGSLVSLFGKNIIKKPGKLLLAPSDREGGGSPGNNTGNVRVKVIKIRE
jgi:hypothetical protein